MTSSKKEFKWFGEGFDGFPKEHAEATVRYNVLCSRSSAPEQITKRLEEIRAAALKIRDEYAHDYLWQREGFNIELGVEDGIQLLHGSTVFGDSIEDEWLIVFLLRELSKSLEDVFIQVKDTDGEFLLIEAANALPKWLNPEVADSRVWIHNGFLVIIPLEQEDSKKESLNLSAALAVLQSNKGTLFTSDDLQKEAFFRVEKYPARIEDNCHCSIIKIPSSLATLIHKYPRSINTAVEALYLRDPLSMEILSGNKIQGARKTESLRFSTDELVDMSVKFTKIGFAQLKSQEFDPPPGWEAVFDSLTDPQRIESKYEIGMKVTCGYEMAIIETQWHDREEFRSLLDDLNIERVEPVTAEEVRSWGTRNDDESWLDVNFEDLEAELAGKRGAFSSNNTNGETSGFGHRSAEENLRKMVSRFEQFLNDDNAGIDGAEALEDMDFDNDSSDLDSEAEDKSGSFDEAEFARMMREMMGLPPETETEKEKTMTTHRSGEAGPLADATSDSDEERDAAEIQRLMQQMEAELNEAGALNLNPANSSSKAVQGSEAEQDLEKETAEINLARNLLESLKDQSGTSGPAQNMLNLLGMQMPRDSDQTRNTKGNNQK